MNTAINTANHESNILAAMVNAFRKNASLSNLQLRIKVRDDLYSNFTAGSVDYLDALDVNAFGRLSAMAFELQQRGR